MSVTLSKEEAYTRLGAIVREMHEALTLLGSNQLNSIVQEIPNARDRLTYVGKMTEDAANKVLGLVEKAKPDCDHLATHGSELSQSLARMASAEDFSVDRARALLMVCGKFADRTARFAQDQAETLSDIMMAQDFQDLSGQVIKKVVDIINRTEVQLVQLLLDSSPGASTAESPDPSATQTATMNVNDHRLEGPQTADDALKQSDVDDLLASLGF
ncbi:protein phosphatase CheZ [Candidatus Symbiobacter mobilis]|uniref:Protein phosphatase CheZ n=1 Tax=Candidatus Symbiobacter mobilis CR TaxID=946483 RepID=U5N9L8_9BURK|nr:protein phosphatase CheZ [Candidatus Symbiobacter mobilis]AGX88102.1 chemotaxis protein CheZ [Candidatus Symbiobacter mobilis CR]